MDTYNFLKTKTWTLLLALILSFFVFLQAFTPDVAYRGFRPYKVALSLSTSDEFKVGQVKWYDRNKGFGFISVDESYGGGDVFVHQSQIKMEGFRKLDRMEKVRFLVDIDPERGQPFAHNVILVHSEDNVGSGNSKDLKDNLVEAMDSFKAENLTAEAEVEADEMIISEKKKKTDEAAMEAEVVSKVEAEIEAEVSSITIPKEKTKDEAIETGSAKKSQAEADKMAEKEQDAVKKAPAEKQNPNDWGAKLKDLFKF